MPLDFKKLNDPAFREEMRREREAEEAAAAAQFLADKWLTLHLEQVRDQLDGRERDLMASVRTRLQMQVGPTPPQRKWMLDIARRKQVDASPPSVALAEYYAMLDSHKWHIGEIEDRQEMDKAIFDRHRIEVLAELSDQHKALFEGFYRHFISEEGAHPKPALPTAA